MNERIKELAIQVQRTEMPGVLFVHPEFVEKFAELLVRECLNEIKNMLVEESELLYPNNKLTTHHVNNRLLDAYDNISELFGVEE